MNLKSAAEQLNLSQAKTKEVAMTVLGSIPSDFNDEQLDAIKKHLALTANNGQALIAGVSSQVNGELAERSPVAALANDLKNIASNGQKIAKLKQIVSGRTYDANIRLWQGYISFQLNQSLNQQQQVLTLFQEQSKRLTANAFDEMTDDIRNQIKRSSGQWINLVVGDFTTELEALANMEVELTQTNSIYEQNLRDAVDELISLG